MDVKVKRIILKNEDVLENCWISTSRGKILVFSPGGSCLNIPASAIRVIEFDDTEV